MHQKVTLKEERRYDQNTACDSYEFKETLNPAGEKIINRKQ